MSMRPATTVAAARAEHATWLRWVAAVYATFLIGFQFSPEGPGLVVFLVSAVFCLLPAIMLGSILGAIWGAIRLILFDE